MIKNNTIKGVFLVGFGATSYGMLATFVKLAYADKGMTGNPFTPAEVISSQFIIGIIVIALINAYQKTKKGAQVLKASKKDIQQLMLVGTSTGLTSIFYYLAVNYIPVSIGIVLLMQTVWMGVLLEMFLEKKCPSNAKLIAVIIVLFGLPISANKRKSGLAAQVGINILIAFIYLVFMKVSQAFGKNGALDPVLTAWFANIIFVAGTFITLPRMKY